MDRRRELSGLVAVARVAGAERRAIGELDCAGSHALARRNGLPPAP